MSQAAVHIKPIYTEHPQTEVYHLELYEYRLVLHHFLTTKTDTHKKSYFPYHARKKLKCFVWHYEKEKWRQKSLKVKYY